MYIITLKTPTLHNLTAEQSAVHSKLMIVGYVTEYLVWFIRRVGSTWCELHNMLGDDLDYASLFGLTQEENLIRREMFPSMRSIYTLEPVEMSLQNICNDKIFIHLCCRVMEFLDRLDVDDLIASGVSEAMIFNNCGLYMLDVESAAEQHLIDNTYIFIKDNISICERWLSNRGALDFDEDGLYVESS